VYRYINDFPAENNKTYQRIMNKLDDLIINTLTKEDKELFLTMIKEAYFKHGNAINSKAEGDTQLMLSTIMALLIEQDKDIEKLKITKQ
jgi:hypothetical protein